MNFDAITREHAQQWKSFTRLMTVSTALVIATLGLLALFLL